MVAGLWKCAADLADPRFSGLDRGQGTVCGVWLRSIAAGDAVADLSIVQREPQATLTDAIDTRAISHSSV